MGLRVRELVRRHGLLLDVALGCVVAALAVLAMWSTPEFITFDYHDPDALGVALAVLGGAAVAVRSRWPVPAFCLAAVVSLLPVLLGYHQTIGGLPALLTLYTVAVARPARVSATALAALTLLVVGVLVGGPLDPTTSDWVGNALVLATGWTVGRSVRQRRSYTARLEERNHALLAARASETRAALVDERTRIAREMQDLVAHSLTTVTVQAAAARRLLRTDPDTAEDVLAEAERVSREALEEMRRILGVLRPEGEDVDRAPQPGLADLAALVGQARAGGLDVGLTTTGAPSVLEPGVGLTAYRMVQEALDNACRYAGRARVDVDVTWRDHVLSIEVRDDGRGVVTWNSDINDGHGLQSVKQRVQAYGGRLRAGPRGGGGFAVTATLPTTGGRA